MDIIGLLILLVIVCVAIWAARAILAAFSIGEPIATIVNVIIVIFALIALLNLVGYGPGLHIARN